MLRPDERAVFERELRRLCDRGEHRRAATRALEAYGPEVYGYLVATARGESDAAEAFSLFAEDVWRGLAGFRWEASLRTWAYTLARNALSRHLRAERRYRGLPLSEAPEVFEIAARVRTRTREYMRTEVKDRYAELRRELDPEDQHLLLLRIGRKMSWNDIARVLGGGGSPSAEALKKETARLRKRFERAKAALAELARERGLR